MSEPTAVIFTALKEELAAINAAIPNAKREGVRILRAGMGWDAATRATQELLRSTTPRWICFSGFCGGLAGSLEVGDIVLATHLVLPLDPQPPVSVAPEILNPLSAALKSSGMRFQLGPIVCARAAVISVKAKRDLGRDSQCLAVDMESYAVAKAAGDTCPVFALRAVSDSADDALPPEVAGFLDANGDVRMGKVTRFLLGGPTNAKKLWALKARSDKASASLTAAWKAAWPVLRS